MQRSFFISFLPTKTGLTVGDISKLWKRNNQVATALIRNQKYGRHSSTKHRNGRARARNGIQSSRFMYRWGGPMTVLLSSFIGFCRSVHIKKTSFVCHVYEGLLLLVANLLSFLWNLHFHKETITLHSFIFLYIHTQVLSGPLYS